MKNTYATFNDPEMAERAGGALLDHGVKADNISIVFPEGFRSVERDDKNDGSAHSEDTAKSGITTTTIEDAQSGAAKGAGIGLAAGTIAALAAIFVPGVGLVLGGGALALALGGMAGTTAAGAVAGGVTGFLKDQGIPSDVTEDYERVIRSGGALLTITPTDDTVDQETIESILTKYNGVISSYMPVGSAAVMVDNHSRAEDSSAFDTHGTKR